MFAENATDRAVPRTKIIDEVVNCDISLNLEMGMR